MEDSFGEVLRAKRRAANLSQRELAAQLGMDFSYISKLENGRLPPPSADTVVAISRILSCQPEELLALAGKLPSEVQGGVGRHPRAQEFLLNAQRMGLSDEEWGRMVAVLRELRGDE
ncbi:MAG: helix-turn-helix domain-containing protein [Chloroflexota bacterium]|nr:helix-turn-helix domain-containing protein [Chloroflexota bacterium]